ncbi:helix-turn-helix transcriptional regulator [Actinomarinicola tropica]|uniref:Helix-turn-helix domain-containing protein n=1 Tax=Actinomarinicola tropica TaxID=2789776 RepID=A0A5Q2RDR9_9ACTN|nr:helix-turn-helix transcriptional regulator [Actinomarinicola tropica]QGG93834.1 helix-turn-helix domain-containing protein [Actinomarinicola tropica]
MTLTATPRRHGAGPLLREWRQRRRMSQLDLASSAEVSPRHLSFVETGRSAPSRELLLHLAEHLDVPIRERNTLLLAAGYAPVYGERDLDDEEMDPVRTALEHILAGHEPYPAVILDRRGDLVLANGAALRLFTEGVADHLLEAPVNAYRLGLHPDGLASRVRNVAVYSHHLLTRLRREAALSGDPALAALLEEVRGFPDLTHPSVADHDPAQMLFLPMELTTVDGVELTFFSTLATFGTALDATVAELSIESFFPADDATRRHLRTLAG